MRNGLAQWQQYRWNTKVLRSRCESGLSRRLENWRKPVSWSHKIGIRFCYPHCKWGSQMLTAKWGSLCCLEAKHSNSARPPIRMSPNSSEHQVHLHSGFKFSWTRQPSCGLHENGPLPPPCLGCQRSRSRSYSSSPFYRCETDVHGLAHGNQLVQDRDDIDFKPWVFSPLQAHSLQDSSETLTLPYLYK
jgi:hypothetical protein